MASRISLILFFTFLGGPHNHTYGASLMRHPVKSGKGAVVSFFM